MKTNKFSSTLIGLGALALALSLNFVNASNDYGISDNSLSQQVLAQTNSSGSGSGSGSGSSSDSGSGSGTVKDGYYIKRLVAAKPRTEVHCDGRTHTVRTIYGNDCTCEGKGETACKAGWYPSSYIVAPEFTPCPGLAQCQYTK